MFRASSLPIIRSFLLYTDKFHAGLIIASKQSQDGVRMELSSILTLLGNGHQKPV